MCITRQRTRVGELVSTLIRLQELAWVVPFIEPAAKAEFMQMAISLRTPRLLLREWRDDDREQFAWMSEDPAVTEMLLPMDRAASDAWITQMQGHCRKHGFCQ
jgi:RimJ/RimL family protein N-acetyltransferase